jgi:hypothetical protein
MTPLGKSLVFYLKYPAEMARLSGESEELDLTGLEDAERVREMATAVGAAATNEGVELLVECAEKIKTHFRALANVVLGKEARRSTIFHNWMWYGIIGHTSVLNGWVQCGISLYDQEGILAPWLWRRGGRAWEEAVKQRLGARVHSLAGEGVVWSGGTVALARIPVFDANQQGDDVDRDALVEKVVGAFSVIQADDVEALSRDVGEQEDSPESDEEDSGGQ